MGAVAVVQDSGGCVGNIWVVKLRLGLNAWVRTEMRVADADVGCYVDCSALAVV